MSGIVFTCKKCGTCCRNLIEDVHGVKTGLLLTVKEIGLFPSNMISPKLAIGREKPEKVIQYQLNVDNCPHVNEKNECQIYEKKPLMCKAFPYETQTVSVKCPVIGSHMKENQFCEVEISSTELEASEKMNRHILNRFKKFFQKGQRIWEFDLDIGNWTVKN